MKQKIVSFIKKIITSPDFLPVLIVLFFGVLAALPLLGKGYFNMHDDLQMMRQLQMEKCILDGQIPCRWIPDMGYGFGFPLFNFYPPLPYLVGQGIRALGYDFVSSAKGIFVVALVASGVSMYYLGKQFFGRLGGILSAVFYIWAPYHALDVYVRGAANEAWALVFFPVILWTSYRLIKEKKKLLPWMIGLAVSWFGLLTSHNLMVIIFTPVFGVWCLIWLLREKAWRKIPQLLISGIFAFGLAAFFTLPALLENKYTHVSSVLSGYYDYSGHFATISQILFSRFWGYGASVWLEADGMSFQVGHIHWIASIIILGIVAYNLIKKRKLDEISTNMIFFFVAGWAATFLIHSRSTPIWLAVKPLAYLQFPWRFLALPTFLFSVMIGSVAKMEFLKKAKGIIIGILIVGVVIFNWNYFKPENGRLGNLTDETKFTGAAWELQQTAGIWDYLPATAEFAPREPMRHLVEVMEGEATTSAEMQGTNWAKFDIEVTKDAVVRMGIFQFPGWEAYVDGQKVDTFVAEDEEWGRIYFKVPAGSHKVTLQFVNTPVRTVGNAISAFAWIVLLTYPLWRKKITNI